MKWKDFFYFSKSQQIGIIVLLALVLFTTAAVWVMPLIVKPIRQNTTDTTFWVEAREFRESLKEVERSKNKWKDKYVTYQNSYKRNYPNYKKRTYAQEKYELFDFDPNVADSATLVNLGLPSYVVSNIVKYRQKGGSFRNADDFSKIYGIDNEKFEELKPYIHIAEPNLSDLASQKKEKNKKTIEIIELNTADTTQLMQLPRVGRYTAYEILKYRRALGGFYSVNQLKEIKNMRTENYEQFAPYCIVDEARIEPISINTAGVEILKRHPYIGSFQRAKAIYDYRRYKIKLNNINDLKAVPELTEQDLKKLEPYLNFE